MQAGPVNDHVHRVQLCLYRSVSPQENQHHQKHIRRPGKRDVAFTVTDLTGGQVPEIEFIAWLPDLEKNDERTDSGHRCQDVGEQRADEIRDGELRAGKCDPTNSRRRQDSAQAAPAAHDSDHISGNEQRNRSTDAADARA